MKKLKFPTPYTVLMLVIILAASLTFSLPSGAYNTLQYNKANDTFVIHTSDSTYALPATQEQLKDLGINIQLSKFKEEKYANLSQSLIRMYRANLITKVLNQYSLPLLKGFTILLTLYCSC